MTLIIVFTYEVASAVLPPLLGKLQTKLDNFFINQIKMHFSSSDNSADKFLPLELGKKSFLTTANHTC